MADLSVDVVDSDVIEIISAEEYDSQRVSIAYLVINDTFFHLRICRIAIRRVKGVQYDCVR